VIAHGFSPVKTFMLYAKQASSTNRERSDDKNTCTHPALRRADSANRHYRHSHCPTVWVAGMTFEDIIDNICGRVALISGAAEAHYLAHADLDCPVMTMFFGAYQAYCAVLHMLGYAVENDGILGTMQAEEERRIQGEWN